MTLLHNISSYWTTMRPYLTFVSGAVGLVGLSFIPDPDLSRVVLAFIPLFLSYGFGQALTDCFQTDTDALSSPYRPLVKGEISKKLVMTVSLVGLVAGTLVLAYLNWLNLILGVLAVVGLLTYTTLKRTWWGGPPWNAWIVALLPVMGRLVDKSYDLRNFIRLENPENVAFLLAVLAVFFGYANFVIMGYFKDISADRQTRYRTFPVVFGWTAGAIYSDVTAIATAGLTAVVLLMIGTAGYLSIAVFIVAVGINLASQIRIHLTRDEDKTHAPIAGVVRAFILYCLTMVVACHPGWIVSCALFYLLFEVTLRFRPEVTQV